MGQGQRRKKNDRQPQSARVLSNTNGQVEITKDEFTSNSCLASFEEQVPESSGVVDGLPVTLDEVEGIFWITFSGNRVKQLNKRHSDMVRKCKAIGVHYRGIIYISKSEKAYAKFTRVL